jgi:hypothetical protein
MGYIKVDLDSTYSGPLMGWNIKICVLTNPYIQSPLVIMTIKFVTILLPHQLPHKLPPQLWHVMRHMATPYSFNYDILITYYDVLNRHKCYDVLRIVTKVYDVSLRKHHWKCLVTHLLWHIIFRHRSVIEANLWHKNDFLWHICSVIQCHISCSAKERTSFTVCGTTQSSTSFTFPGSTAIPPLEITWPRNGTSSI